MHTLDPPSRQDPHFEALKAMTRLQWMLDFEAVATVPDRHSAIAAHPAPKAPLN